MQSDWLQQVEGPARPMSHREEDPGHPVWSLSDVESWNTVRFPFQSASQICAFKGASDLRCSCSCDLSRNNLQQTHESLPVSLPVSCLWLWLSTLTKCWLLSCVGWSSLHLYALVFRVLLGNISPIFIFNAKDYQNGGSEWNGIMSWGNVEFLSKTSQHLLVLGCVLWTAMGSYCWHGEGCASPLGGSSMEPSCVGTSTFQVHSCSWPWADVLQGGLLLHSGALSVMLSCPGPFLHVSLLCVPL